MMFFISFSLLAVIKGQRLSRKETTALYPKLLSKVKWSRFTTQFLSNNKSIRSEKKVKVTNGRVLLKPCDSFFRNCDLKNVIWTRNLKIDPKWPEFEIWPQILSKPYRSTWPLEDALSDPLTLRSRQNILCE